MKTNSWRSLTASTVMRFLFTIALVTFWVSCADDSQNLKGPDADAGSAKGKSTENTNYSPTFASADGYTWTITVDQAGKKALSHMIIQMVGCDGTLLSISDISSVVEILPEGVVAPDSYAGLDISDTEGNGTGCAVGAGHFVKIQNFVNKTGVLVIQITFASKVTSISLLLKAGTFCTPTPFTSSQTVTISCTTCENEETAWGEGTEYPCNGGWATYSTYVEDGSLTLFAGQTSDAGTAVFSSDGNNVTITITLNAGWQLNSNKGEPIKVRAYANAPTAGACPVQIGHFEFKTYSGSGGIYTITVPGASYYGIHLDVVNSADCGG